VTDQVEEARRDDRPAVCQRARPGPNLNLNSKPNLNQALEEAGETIDQLLASERALKQALILKSAYYLLAAYVKYKRAIKKKKRLRARKQSAVSAASSAKLKTANTKP
jgi:hypothetical protein